MIPFQEETLEELLRLLCKKFIRKDTLDAARTTYILLKADVTDISNHKSVSDVDIGFALKHDIKILWYPKKWQRYEFAISKKKQCSSLYFSATTWWKKTLLILNLEDVYLVFDQIIWQISLKSVESYLQKY